MPLSRFISGTMLVVLDNIDEKKTSLFTSIQDLKFVFKKCVNPKMKTNLDSQINVSIG